MVFRLPQPPIRAYIHQWPLPHRGMRCLRAKELPELRGVLQMRSAETVDPCGTAQKRVMMDQWLRRTWRLGCAAWCGSTRSCARNDS